MALLPSKDGKPRPPVPNSQSKRPPKRKGTAKAFRNRSLPSPSTNGHQKPPGHTAGETPAKERYSVYRTLKIMQLLLQQSSDFIFLHSPHFDDVTALAARKLHGEIARQMPVVALVIGRCEGGSFLRKDVIGTEGGDA